MVVAGTWCDEEAGGGAAPEHHRHQAGMLGLALASVAITLAAREPPPWLRGDAYYYFVALISGAFFVGVADSIWAATGARRRAARSKKLAYASTVALLGAAAGLELASLLL
ncbi:uncharacterized protein C2845_PM08G05420 [Panicum miliaceum]|uniref:Uncharacterized protein n=1 Tax=Panicum miliaceum TaxID=4540 RepID=A0A3L6QW62_PANMI|nr:uncharacterized protein C2845_PM08G05420 [Panicum miliaceum]